MEQKNIMYIETETPCSFFFSSTVMGEQISLPHHHPDIVLHFYALYKDDAVSRVWYMSSLWYKNRANGLIWMAKLGGEKWSLCNKMTIVDEWCCALDRPSPPFSSYFSFLADLLFFFTFVTIKPYNDSPPSISIPSVNYRILKW